MNILSIKVGLAVGLLGLLGLVWQNRSRVDAFFVGKSDGWVWLLWAGLRLLPFGILYIGLGYDTTSDLVGFYNGAVAGRAGQLVYRDYISVYAPFFSYITALPTYLWNDPKSLVLLMISVEGLLLWITRRRYRLSLTTVLLYLLLPATCMLSVLGGQEDIWMWGFGLLTIWALQRPRYPVLWAGAALGLALLTTKALFVLFVPVVFWWVRPKVQLVAAMLAVGLPVLGWLYAISGLAFLMPTQLAQEPFSPNLWSITYPFVGSLTSQIPPKIANYAMLLVVTGITTIYTLGWKNRQTGQPGDYARMLARAWVVIFCLIILFLPSAYAVYAFGFLLPLVTLPGWDQGRTRWFVLTFSGLCAIEPSFWWRLGRRFYTLTDLTQGLFLLDYLMQLGILTCLIYFLWWLRPANVPADRPLP